MEKVTSETIKANFPEVWWQIYRQARAETLADRNFQEQAAKAHLQRSLAKPGAASPAQPSSASTTPRPSAVTISAEQEKINRLMGISPEIFIKYSHETPSQLDPVQAEINRKLGLSEEDYLRHVR